MATPYSAGRMLRKNFLLTKEFASLSLDSQLLSCYLIPHFNSFGKQSGDPRVIKGTVVPFLPYYTVKKIVMCLLEINKKINMRWFLDNSQLWLQDLDWHKFQKLRTDRVGPDYLPSYTEKSISMQIDGLVPDLLLELVPDLVQDLVQSKVEEEGEEEECNSKGVFINPAVKGKILQQDGQIEKNKNAFGVNPNKVENGKNHPDFQRYVSHINSKYFEFYGKNMNLNFKGGETACAYVNKLLVEHSCEILIAAWDKYMSNPWNIKEGFHSIADFIRQLPVMLENEKIRNADQILQPLIDIGVKLKRIEA